MGGAPWYNELRHEQAQRLCEDGPPTMPEPRLRFKVVSDVLGGQEFVLEPHWPITIGRTDENSVVLDHKSVSRRHAKIEKNGGYYVLTDLGSHNGTRVGQQLVTRHYLKPEDVVWFGQVGVEFSLENDSQAAPGCWRSCRPEARPAPRSKDR